MVTRRLSLLIVATLLSTSVHAQTAQQYRSSEQLGAPAPRVFGSGGGGAGQLSGPCSCVVPNATFCNSTANGGWGSGTGTQGTNLSGGDIFRLN